MAHQEKLQAVHDALLEEMQTLQKNLPADVEEISEAFERYARVVALLVRSLESLLKLNQNQTQDIGSGRRAAQDLLTEIEHRLARITQGAGKKNIPDVAE